MRRKAIRRGALFYADLDPVVGSEQGGTRPILILQNDVGNYFSPPVVAAALTSRRDKTHLPTHVIGQINKKKMKEIDTALAISVGLRSLA